MDPTHQEESVPLPLPVDKQYQAQYLKEDFENRLRGAKTSVVVHGQVRQTGEREPIKIMMPTAEDLDRWVEVSKKFGQEIKREKEMQRSIAKGGAQDLKVLNGGQRLEMMEQLKPQHKGVPFLSLNPAVQRTSDLNQPMYSHVPRQMLFPKEVRPKEPRSQRQKVKKIDAAAATEKVQQMPDKTSPQTVSDTFIEVNTLADRKRPQNKEPWNKAGDVKNPLTYLKTRKFYDKTGVAERLIQTQKSALAQMKADNAEPKIAEEDSQVEGIRAKKYQKVSDICIQDRRKEMAQIRQQQCQQTWPARQDPSYQNDLRALYRKDLEAVKDKEDKRLNISRDAWVDVIDIQDQWQRLSEFAGQSLKKMSAEPDPVLVVSKLPSVKLQRTIRPDFIPLNAKSEVRVKNIQDFAKKIQAENKREDLGILAYMRRNGLEKPQNKYNSEATIREFRHDTAYHPQYLSRPVVAAEVASQVVETDDSVVTPVPVVTVTKDEDSDASDDSHATGVTNINQASEVAQSKLQIETKQSHHDHSRNSATLKQTSKAETSKAEIQSEHSDLVASPNGELDSSNIYMNSDFWYHKGVVLNQKNQTDSAVACYHQALDINKNHLPSIFNLACNYQKLKQLEKAKHWFKHAINVKPDWLDALYGLCLVNIKLKCSDEAVKYIKKAVAIKGGQDSPHIKYALALAYRANFDWDNALQSYSVIMKNDKNIFEYRKMIDAENQKIIDNNLTEDFGGLNLKIDLYSHFKELGIERKYANDIDLWQYYDPYEGWDYDSIDIVIDLLQRVRFFNRFDSDTLRNMLTKVTMRRLEKNQVLFFKGEEASIVISGKLHLISHELDLATPYVATTYNPGDCIGLDIDNGWSDAEHSWVVSWEVCDVFMISDGYLSYMWDTMKRFSSNLIADMLDKDQYLTQLSEQTLFTIAHDIAKLREYQDGEVILAQSTSSPYNLVYLSEEKKAMVQFMGKDDPNLNKLKAQFKKDCVPRPQYIWDEKDAQNEFNDARAKFSEEEKLLKIGKKKGFDDSESLASDGMASGGNRDSRQNFNSQQSLNRASDSEKMAQLRLNRAKADEKMHSLTEGIKNAKDNCIKLVQNNIERLSNYKNDRKKLPGDADGIYLIVQGQAKVVNPYDPNVELKRIYYYDPAQDQQKNARGEIKACAEEDKKFGDYFGGSKFLQEQGYDVFGDIVACSDQTATKKKVKGSDTVTTCLFLRKDLLYLIPFYDLYLLKEINRKRLDMKKLRKECHTLYKDKMRNMKERLLRK